MPNPDRKIANGRPLYTSLVHYFADDVSGNRSKSWNKHNNVYFSHANLPRELRHQEAHMHFVSTLQHTIPAEQFHAMREMIWCVCVIRSRFYFAASPYSIATHITTQCW